MTSLTIPLSEEMKEELTSFDWINWSGIAREEVLKKVILDNYLKIGKITEEEWKFCEKVDWHPVDELPISNEFKKRLMKISKGKFLKIKSVEDILK